MWKFVAFLLFAAVCVKAEDEIPQQNGPEPVSIVQTVLCYVSPTPWNCVKEQAGRMLNVWEAELEESRHNLMVEADDEMKEKQSRGLPEDETTDRPSEVMSALDKGLSALSNAMSDEINVLRGRESRALNNKESKDVFDDANDFNDDDFSVLDTYAKQEGKGNLTDEARAKKGMKQGYVDDDDGGYGYGYRGKGKKGKKGKKGLMKMFFLGAIIKSKIELLLKILSFHLQLKFFAIAVAGLFINLARFWIDLKKQPQKHHYDEHDDWGSNWKRQASQNDNYQQDNFAHRLAYNSGPYPQ